MEDNEFDKERAERRWERRREKYMRVRERDMGNEGIEARTVGVREGLHIVGLYLCNFGLVR